MLRHPCILAGPQQGGQNQKSQRTLGVTMMLLVPKRGFKDCPGFLNSTRRLGPKRAEMLRHPCILAGPQQGGQNQKSQRTLGVTMMLLVPKRGFEDCPGFLNRKVGAQKRAEMLRHPCILTGPQQRGTKSEVTRGVTMMLLVPKRGFKDCPGFLNSTWGPKEGGNATSPLHPRGSPTKGDKIRCQNVR